MAIQRSSYGFPITFKVNGVDFSTLTAAKLVFLSPLNKIVKERVINISDINAEAKTVRYLVQENDFDEVGAWRVQFIDISDGRRVASAEQQFDVLPNIFPGVT